MLQAQASRRLTSCASDRDLAGWVALFTGRV
jgi:hypothetical protein